MALPSLADDGDWQTWTEAAWTQNMGNGLDTVLRFEPRMTDDFSEFSYYELESMLVWRYSPRWDFALGYERDERLQPMEEVAHVPSLSATLKIPRQPWRLIPTLDWRFSNRSRLDFMIPEEETSPWQPVYRNRTEMEARWRWGSKEVVPFVFEEWFFNLDHGNFTENRLGAGFGYPFAPHWMARLYFMRLDQKTAQGWEWHPVMGVQIQAQF